MTIPVSDLAHRVRAGDPRAVSRAITVMEDASHAASELVAALHPFTGSAYVIGVTGPPGAGKSTLVDRLTTNLRASGQRVGILAVDPTSPFTGGAILGDRVRMQAHAADPGVFIRSMATRGYLGGLSRATGEAALVLDAAGYDTIVVETVGVGQGEVDIVRTADVALVVLVPGSGDEVQALKAGVMEIADVFVVNKTDQEGADRASAAIESVLGLAPLAEGSWRPPIVRTVATSGAGIADVLAAIAAFRAQPVAADRRRRRSATRLRDALDALFTARIDSMVDRADWDALVADVDERRVDPYAAARAILTRILR